jgi:hypothetical protein
VGLRAARSEPALRRDDELQRLAAAVETLVRTAAGSMRASASAEDRKLAALLEQAVEVGETADL